MKIPVPALPMSLAALQAGLDASPYIAFLGLRMVSVDAAAQRVVVRVPMRPVFERGKGTGQWHGGPIAGVIDTVGDFALIMMLGRVLPTINFRVDYLRPAISTDLLATGIVRRTGKSVGVVDVEVADEEGRIVAVGRASYSTLA